MSPELRDLLHDAAGEPRSGATDLDDIRRRAGRIRRGRRIRNGVATLAVVALAVPAVNVARSLLPEGDITVTQDPDPEPTVAPTASPQPGGDPEPSEPLQGEPAFRLAGASLDGFVWTLRPEGLWDERATQLVPLPPGVLPADIGAVDFLDSDLGWLLTPPTDGTSGATVHRTDDHGRTWTSRNVALPSAAPFDDWSSATIEPFDRDTVFLVLSAGPGGVADRGAAIARSTDGGRTFADLGRSPGSRVVRFSAPDIGWSVSIGGGEHDRLWRTGDAGATWTEAALEEPPADTTLRLLDVAFHDDTADAIGVLDAPQGRRLVLYTFGSPWTATPVETPPVLLDAEQGDPFGQDLTAVSVGPGWWIVQAPGQVPVSVTTERAVVWTEVVQPVASWFEEGDEIVAVSRRSCRCVVLLVSDDGYAWHDRT